MSSVAIVLGTYDRLAALQRALASLPLGAPWTEVIVIDGGSTDGTVEYLRSLPNVRAVFQSALVGQTRAYNPVLRGISADHVYLHADDAELVPGMLERAVAILDGRPDIGLIGLKMRDMSGGSASREYMGGISEFGVFTCNHPLVRTSMLRRVGYLCERYRSYLMDADLTAAVLVSGAAVALTKAVGVLHHRGWTVDDPSAAARIADTNAAVSTYRDRFRFLGVPLAWRVRRSVGVRLARALFRAPGGTRRLGLSRQDWINLASARFVALGDPWRHGGDDYYLEQRVPQHFVTAPGNPIAPVPS